MDLLQELDALRTAQPPTEIQKEHRGDLVYERDALLERLKAVAQKALDEKRELTGEERATYDRGVERVKAIAAEFQRRYDRQQAQGPVHDGPVSVRGNGLDPVYARPGNGADAPMILRARDGREIRAARPGELFADVADGARGGPGSDIGLGAFVRATVCGPRNEAERRALDETISTGGSYTVPTPLAAQIVDCMRRQAVCIQAGMVTIPMTSASLAMARMVTDPAVRWHAEGAGITAADPTIEGILFSAKTVYGLTIASVELIEDTANLEGLIGDMIGKALALEVDRCALRGATATPANPIGILHQSRVNVTGYDKPVTAYDWFSDAILPILNNNGVPNSVIYSPGTAVALDKLIDEVKQPLRPTPAYAALPNKLVTTAIPDDLGTPPAAETEIYTGDFRALWLGMRTEARLEISRLAPGAWDTLSVAIRVYLRCDIQLAHPEWFSVLTGVNKAGGT